MAVYVYGLFWKGTTRAGAWAGVLSGLAISIGFSLYYGLDAGLIPMIGAAAMVIPLLVVPLVSLLSPKFSQVHLNKVYGASIPESKYIRKRLAADDIITS